MASGAAFIKSVMRLKPKAQARVPSTKLLSFKRVHNMFWASFFVSRFVVCIEASSRKMELIRAQKQSRNAKKNEPKNATSKGGAIKKFAPKLARNGPKIAPKIPPPTTNAVALFLA